MQAINKNICLITSTLKVQIPKVLQIIIRILLFKRVKKGESQAPFAPVKMGKDDKIRHK